MTPSLKDTPPALARQRQLIATLCDRGPFPHPAKHVQLIETHISWVLLAGRFAYKIKKALDLGFLDYSTLTARRFCCDEEIRLNRRLAPQLYLDTVPIGGSPDAPLFGEQPAIEYAVRMRRFAAIRQMDHQLTLGRVTPLHMDQLAELVANFHACLPGNASYGQAADIHAVTLENLNHLQPLLGEDSDRALLARLQSACDTEFAACAAVIEQRRLAGYVRECHGDLHLGNIALLRDHPVPFDGIEFSPALRWTDTMSELAFTVMDLLHRKRADYAWRFLNSCLQISGDYAGMVVLRYYLAYRALVRAKVSAIRASQPGQTAPHRQEALEAGRSYLALASNILSQRRPALLLTHGLPGSGKTYFSQLALERLGAIRLRSDVERKRLYGLAALDNSRARVGDIYSPDATRRTYDRLLDLARTLLQAGYPVIVDAAFLSQNERQQFRQLTKELSTPFAIASLQADDATLRARILQRHNDASEADLAVLELLQNKQEPLTEDELAHTVTFNAESAWEESNHDQSWRRLTELLSH